MNDALKILVQAQFDNSQKAIDDLNKQLKQLEIKLNKINVNIDPNFVKTLSNNLTDIANKIDKVTQKQNELNKAFEVQNKADGVARYSDLQKRVEEIKNSAKEISKITVDTKKDINDLEKATISYKDALGRLVQERYKLIETDEKISNGNTTKTIKEWELESQKVVDNLEQQRKRLANLGTQISNKVDPALFDFGRQDDLKQFIQQFHDGEVKITKFKESLQNGKNRLVEFNVQVQKGKKDVEEYKYYFDELTNTIYKNSAALKNNSNNQLGLAEQLGIAIERTVVWATAMTGFYGSLRAIESMLQEILLVDKAMTDLKRVMDATPEQYNELLGDSINLSKELGANIHDVLKTMTGFARAGDYTKEQLMELTRVATIMSRISELTPDQAMENLLSIGTQFGMEIENYIDIASKLNEVDNRFATSTKDLSDALARSGSVAKEYNITLDEMLGYITSIQVATKASGAEVSCYCLAQ